MTILEMRVWHGRKFLVGDYTVITLHDYAPVILKNALIYSDNIYFAKAALKIGADN